MDFILLGTPKGNWRDPNPIRATFYWWLSRVELFVAFSLLEFFWCSLDGLQSCKSCLILRTYYYLILSIISLATEIPVPKTEIIIIIITECIVKSFVLSQLFVSGANSNFRCTGDLINQDPKWERISKIWAGVEFFRSMLDWHARSLRAGRSQELIARVVLARWNPVDWARVLTAYSRNAGININFFNEQQRALQSLFFLKRRYVGYGTVLGLEIL
jgi:hypothetical protein